MSAPMGDPSLTYLLEGIASLDKGVWLKELILSALADASSAASIESFYRHYYLQLVDALEDPDDAELADFLFSRMLESEGVVNALVQEQRDHLRHTIHDFLLGYLILNSTSYFQPLGADLALRTGHDGDPMLFLNRAWFLAAHFHDLGYPVQFHHFSLDFARQVVQDFPHVVTSFHGSAMTYGRNAPLGPLFAWRAALYAAEEERRRKVPILSSHALRRQLDLPDHALTAAFLLWDQAREADLTDSSKRCFNAPVLRTAALACASHNFQYYASPKDEWFRISLRCDPISFLLHLIDEAQEWSRERIDASLLWERGEPKHRYSDVRLRGTPCVRLSSGGDLDVQYDVARTPLLDSPADLHQIERSREMLERDLIGRNRRLAEVLRIDRTPGIRLDARYHLIAPSSASPQDVECTVRLQVGRHESEWVCRFAPVRRSEGPSLEPAGAVRVVNRERGARVFVGADGSLKAEDCQIGETLLRVDGRGLVTDCGLRPATLYLLLGAGGVGKSTLLRNLAANAPPSWSAFHVDFIPPEARELDLSTRQSAEKAGRLFLVDHFDHTLSQRSAEYWKEELSRIRVPDDAALVFACRSEVADEWPYVETRQDVQVVEAFREGHFLIQPEQFVQEKLRMLRPSVREELSQFAYRTNGKRWIRATEAAPGLVDRAGPEMIRPVGGRLRFDHDYLQDALSTLAILREISKTGAEIELGPILVDQPPWVYVFLIWSLCGQTRGVSPFLDIGLEAYLRLRRTTLDAFLRAFPVLQWLELTGAHDVGAVGEKRIPPIVELESILAKEEDTVRPAHVGMVADIAVRSLRYLEYILPPDSETVAKELMEFSLRFHEHGKRTEYYFADLPASPTKWWFMRRHNVIMKRADLYTRPYPAVHPLAKCFENWKSGLDEKKAWIENAPVDKATKVYWLAVWMLDLADAEFIAMICDDPSQAKDRDELAQKLRRALDYSKKSFFHRRRAIEASRSWIEEGSPPPVDGYLTMAQAFGDQAYAYERVMRSYWPIIGRLGEDPLDQIVELTVRYDREIRHLWERARRSLRSGEVLPRFYAPCSRVAAYAAAVRAFRNNPDRPFHEVVEATQTQFINWLKPYPFEAARDPVFEGSNRTAQLDNILEIVKKLESYLRKEAREWIGGKERSQY